MKAKAPPTTRSVSALAPASAPKTKVKADKKHLVAVEKNNSKPGNKTKPHVNKPLTKNNKKDEKPEKVSVKVEKENSKPVKQTKKEKVNVAKKSKQNVNSEPNPDKKNVTIDSEPIKTIPRVALKRRLEEFSDDPIKPDIPEQTILKALTAIKKLEEIHQDKKNELFDDEAKLIMQVECIKIPNCPKRKLRLNLPHWLVTDTSDICLFTADIKKGKKVDHEPTIQHYEDLLRSKGITRIKTIMPMRQFTVEYSQSEMKRRLLTQFEFFLCDGKISGHMTHKLGTKFHTKNQLPVPVNLTKSNLKEEIENALHKTALPIHGDGTSYTIRVANMQHTPEQMLENVQAILLQITEQFPGGWNNIRSVYLKTAKSSGVPIYVTLKSKNDVPNIDIKSPHQIDDVVEGEVDTVTNGTVRVHPDGTVDVIRNEKTNGRYGKDAKEEVPSKKAKLDIKQKNEPKEDLGQGSNANENCPKKQNILVNGNAGSSDSEMQGDRAEDDGDDSDHANLQQNDDDDAAESDVETTDEDNDDNDDGDDDDDDNDDDDDDNDEEEEDEDDTDEDDDEEDDDDDEKDDDDEEDDNDENKENDSDEAEESSEEEEGDN